MRLVNENTKMNTDFHYAYEFMDILRTSAIEPSYSMVKGVVSHLAAGLVPPLPAHDLRSLKRELASISPSALLPACE